MLYSQDLHKNIVVLIDQTVDSEPKIVITIHIYILYTLIPRQLHLAISKFNKQWHR